VDVFKKVQELGMGKKHKAIQVLAQTLFTSDIITGVPGYLPIFQRCVATRCYRRAKLDQTAVDGNV
jgi:translation initiation factor 5